MLTLETIQNDTLWIAKMTGWREVGTYAEIGYLFNEESCRDFDLSCDQPDHLKEFYDAYFEYGKEHGFLTIPDYYNNVYTKKPVKRVWSEEEIKSLLKSNDKFLIRALIKLYGFQTESEQSSERTIEHNGMGFNAIDSGFLTSVSKFYLSKGYITDKQKMAVRKCIYKYAGQLVKIANA